MEENIKLRSVPVVDTTECFIDEYYPVRCRTCGYVLGAKEYPYKELIYSGVSQKEALDRLNIRRTCCRTEMLCPQKISSAPRIPDVETYKLLSENIKKKTQTEVEEKATDIRKRLSEMSLRTSKPTISSTLTKEGDYKVTKQPFIAR
jgi:DNA-directed RNA polymerase subunit N (RpoN/RPB10)